MGMEYTSTVAYGFIHKVTKWSVDKLHNLYQVEGDEQHYAEAPEEYLEESMYSLSSRMEGVLVDIYHDEQNGVDDITMVVRASQASFSFNEHYWMSRPPFYLETPEAPEELLKLQELLGEPRVGWIVYSQVF